MGTPTLFASHADDSVASEAAALAGEFLATVDRMQEIVRDERRTSVGDSDRDKGE